MVDDGETVIDEPLPTAVPPQLPLYHCQLAAVPRLPPLTVSVTVPPEQIVVVLEVIEVGAEELVLELMVTDTQDVVLQVPSART